MATSTTECSETTDVTAVPVRLKKGQKRRSSDSLGSDSSIFQQGSRVAISQDPSEEEATSDDPENCFVPNQQRKRRTSGGRFEVSKVFVMENGACSHILPGEVSQFRADNADLDVERSEKTAVNALDRETWEEHRHDGQPTAGTAGELVQHLDNRNTDKGFQIVLNDFTEGLDRPAYSHVCSATPAPPKKRRVTSVSSRRRRRSHGKGRVAAKSRRRLAYASRKRSARSQLALKSRRALRRWKLNNPSGLPPVPSASSLPRPEEPILQTPSQQPHSRRRITFSPEEDGENFACPYKIRFTSPSPHQANLHRRTRQRQLPTPFGDTMRRQSGDHAATIVRCSSLQEIRQETFVTDGLYEEGTTLIGVKSLKEAFLENGGNLKILRETLLKGCTSTDERMQIEAMLGDGEPVKAESSQGRGKNLQDVVDTLSSELSRLTIVPESIAKDKREAWSEYATRFSCEFDRQVHNFGGCDFFTGFRGE